MQMVKPRNIEYEIVMDVPNIHSIQNGVLKFLFWKK